MHNNDLRMARKNFKFKLRVCEDAYVYFLENSQDHNSMVYSLEIGANENTNTYLYKVTDGHYTQVANAETENIVDCEIMRSFWITFQENDGVRDIKFGRGSNLYESQILQYSDHDSAVIYGLSMGTSRLSDKANWEFSKFSGVYRIRYYYVPL